LLTVNIIGAGAGGLAASIRLAAKGFKVSVFESASHPGGKLSEFSMNGYRFDRGPSLFTLPEQVDELKKISGSKEEFSYSRLDPICHYFYEDGTQFTASANQEKFATVISEKLGENRQAVLDHLKHSQKLYDLTTDLFLHQSLHKIRNFLNLKTLKAIANLGALQMSKTMNEANSEVFNNKKTVQLFNRYATYNGSSPYKAPALLNVIPHLEYNLGAYLPKGGMYDITKFMYNTALKLGVKLYFDTKVEKIITEKDRAKGIVANGKEYLCDIVVSDADIHTVYNKLMPSEKKPEKTLNQEKSTAAHIFYWGIKKEFKELGLHNILFSEDYVEEFDALFKREEIAKDPTLYINITSKYCREDAPPGCENWFIYVHAPHNKSHKPVTYVPELRKNIIAKINRILKTDIEKYIECEQTWDAYKIEQETSSHGGSLYGNASNSKYSAFLRHANFSSHVKDLYFCGGSVHPGGGVPISLLSAKIATGLIFDRYVK
jgi:phytoene desaturase